MLWDQPLPWYLGNYRVAALALGGLVVLAVGASLLHARQRSPDARALGLRRPLLALGIGLAGLVALWWAVHAGTPAWDTRASQALQVWGSAAPRLAALSAAFVGLPFGLAACAVAFGASAGQGSWRRVYEALAAGLGLAAFLVLCKVAFPRAAPEGANYFFPAVSFPSTAPLVPLGLWLLFRARPLLLPRRVRVAVLAVASLLTLAPVATADSWLTDVLAGWAITLVWSASVLVVERAWPMPSPSLGDAAHHEAPPRGFQALAHRIDLWMARRVDQPIGPLRVAIALGIVLRVASIWTSPLGVDANVYAVLAHEVGTTGSLTMPWGDVHTFATEPVASHHYPPMYPLYLAPFVQVLGLSYTTVHVAAIVASLAALVATYWCSRDLYGRVPALVATAVLSLSPIMVQDAAQGYTNGLVTLLFVLTLWAILKSLTRPWFILAAGVFAGLSYLTKSTMGYFFLVAGLGGFAWRLYWRGWKVLRDPAYLAAIAAFGSMVLAWSWRNWSLFHSIDTSAHLGEAYAHAFGHPIEWLLRSVVCLVFYFGVGYLLYLALMPWLPTLARVPKLKDEHDSGLWLSIGLPLLLSSVIDAALWMIEDQFFLGNVRYVGFVIVPAAWLLVRHVKVDGPKVRAAILVSLVIMAGASVFFVKPSASGLQRVADDLAPRVAANDTVGFVDMDNHGIYRFYVAITDHGRRDVGVAITCDRNPLCPDDVPGPEALATTWVLAPGYSASRLPSGYVLVTDSPAEVDPAFPDYYGLWHRAS